MKPKIKFTTREQRALIREQAREGRSRKEIAEYMSCCRETVRRVLINKFSPQDNLDEDADYLLGRKGGLAIIDDDTTTPEPQGDNADIKEEREDPDVLSVPNWSPTPVDPNDLPYVGNDDDDESDQAEDSPEKEGTAVLRQSARLRGLKAENPVLLADRKRDRSTHSDRNESVAGATHGDSTSRSNRKRTRQSDEGATEGDSQTEEPQEPSRPSQSGRIRKPSEKAKAVFFNLVEMRRTIQQHRTSGIPANQPAAASTSRSANAAASSSSSSSRAAVAPVQAPHNLNDENVPVPARGQIQVSNNKILSRDAAIKILRDLGLDETHADIVIATGIKSAKHLKGMVDFPEKLLHFIKTDVSEQGFSKWDYFELLSALWQRRDSGWRET